MAYCMGCFSNRSPREMKPDGMLVSWYINALHIHTCIHTHSVCFRPGLGLKNLFIFIYFVSSALFLLFFFYFIFIWWSALVCFVCHGLFVRRTKKNTPGQHRLVVMFVRLFLWVWTNCFAEQQHRRDGNNGSEAPCRCPGGAHRGSLPGQLLLHEVCTYCTQFGLPSTFGIYCHTIGRSRCAKKRKHCLSGVP